MSSPLGGLGLLCMSSPLGGLGLLWMFSSSGQCSWLPSATFEPLPDQVAFWPFGKGWFCHLFWLSTAFFWPLDLHPSSRTKYVLKLQLQPLLDHQLWPQYSQSSEAPPMQVAPHTWPLLSRFLLASLQVGNTCMRLEPRQGLNKYTIIILYICNTCIS